MLGCFHPNVGLNVFWGGSNPTAGSKQPNRWVSPFFTQRWVVFNPAFFRVIGMGVYILKYHNWVKYNPVLGKYWTEHMLGCFQPIVGFNV